MHGQLRSWPLIPGLLVSGALAVAAAVAFAVPAAYGDVPCMVFGSSLSGTAGDDALCGTEGSDTLNGNGGNDQLKGFGGNDTLSGGAGVDTVLGGNGNDLLTGGSSNDVLIGGAGNDRMQYRDGELDTWGSVLLRGGPCGSGADSIDVDLLDFSVIIGLAGSPLIDCEAVSVGALTEGANVVISARSRRVGGEGRTAVRLSCPASLPAPCEGSLRLGLVSKSKKHSEQPQSSYEIRPGDGGSVSVRLSSRDRSTLRRVGRATGRVTAVEKGEFGDKTTIQTVTLRARR